MTLETITSPPAKVGDATVETTSPEGTRRGARRARSRSRRALIGAVVITAAVPTAMLIALWRNLTLPFWFNEQWRAYFISKPGSWFAVPNTGNAPFPAGWFVLERASAALFGSTELAMRLPTALSFPLTCVLLMLLARRWMPLAAAVVVALVAGLTGTLLWYAVQLSEYQIDAAAAVAVLLLHEVAQDGERETWRSLRVYAAYGGIALACVFSTPAVFVAGPVLLLDAVRALRSRTFGPRFASAIGAGVVILCHLGLYVAPQNGLTRTQGWAAQFLPHSGLGRQLAFVWDGFRGFLTGTFTGSDLPNAPELFSPRLEWIVSAVMAAFLCIGVIVAARSRSGRTLLAAIGGSLGLTLIASYIRYWPFGFVRTNLFLVPLLILLAGIGASSSIRFGVGRIRGARQLGRTGRSLQLGIVTGAAVVLALAGVLFAGSYEVGSFRQIHESARSVPYGAGISSAALSVRHQAQPGADLVVTGFMATQGWEYYEYEYGGTSSRAGRPIEPERAAFLPFYGSREITRLVQRTRPTELFLYIPLGSTGAELGADVRAIGDAGATCRTAAQRSYPSSGLLTIFQCTDLG